MSEYLVGLSQLALPEFFAVRQRFATTRVADVGGAVRRALLAPSLAGRLAPGKTVALAVGSRGIAGLRLIVCAAVAALRERGLRVFIVPAMGSHGGGTAEGQREVLARYHVTEDAVGAPILSDMEAERIGQVRYDAAGRDYHAVAEDHPEALPIYMDRHAWREADLVIPLVRIKPHTGFRGRVESGICKMLCIGLGKHIGCSRLHREGYARFAELMPAAAQVALATGRIACSLAVVENAYEEIAHVEAVPGEETLTREAELLEMARALMPRLLLPTIDVLVVEEIGKDISGVGMDANVTGRSELGQLAHFTGPEIKRIVVLGLSKATHGNATGIGMADLTTDETIRAIDRVATYTNVLTSGSLAGGKLPVALPTAEQAILAAASCVPGVAAADAGIVRIRNTLQLAQIAVSRNLLPLVERTAGCEVIGAFTGRWEDDSARP